MDEGSIAGRNASHFADYLSARMLPVKQADMRPAGANAVSMALVKHAPNNGMWFDPIDDIVVSVVVRSGTGQVTRDVGFGRQRFSYGPGVAFFTPSSLSSYWRFDDEPEILHLSMPLDAAKRLIGTWHAEERLPLLARSFVRDPLIGQVARRMWSEGRRGTVVPQTFCEKAMGLILSVLISHDGEGGSAQRSHRSATTLAPWRMRRVLAQIEARGLAVPVAEMARSVQLSPDHIARAFKATTGYSPHEMVRRMRIEEAKTLLTQTRRPMTEIALELGFSSSAHFSSSFRQITGWSPTEWRATQSEN